jgi:glyoxalase family protein
MVNWVTGLHHITGAVSSGQKDYDFYTGVLGLRLVKKTINHETADSWHFFYGDYDGNAGTIMTNFFMQGVPLPPYKRGRGTITEVTYSVPRGSLDFWQKRLAAEGLATEHRGERFGDEVLYFEDPAGLPSELIACDDERNPRALLDLDDSNKLRGFHAATLLSRIPELTLDFFTRLLRCEVVGKEGNRTRLALGAGGPGRYLDLIDEPEAPWGRWGMGGIHHVALTMESKEQMEFFWRILSGDGLILTDLRDRKWFHSMYMTEPGGINVEFSNLAPGWTVDEPLAELGTIVSLPKQWEAERESILAKLPELEL